MSDELSPLLSCPSLPRILCLLDSADDVINCRRVCKRLNGIIERDSKYMTKHVLEVKITVDNIDNGRRYIICCHRAAGPPKSISLNLLTGQPIHYNRETLPDCFNGIRSIRGNIVDVHDCLEKSLFLIFNKFNCLTFESSVTERFNSEEQALLERVFKKTGVRAVRCVIHPQEWKIPIILKSENVFLHWSGIEIIDGSLLLLKTDKAVVSVGRRRWNAAADGSMDIIRRLLQEWSDGERDIFRLTIFVAMTEHIPIHTDFLPMLSHFNSSKVQTNVISIRATLTRDCDGQRIQFIYRRTRLPSLRFINQDPEIIMQLETNN